MVGLGGWSLRISPHRQHRNIVIERPFAKGFHVAKHSFDEVFRRAISSGAQRLHESFVFELLAVRSVCFHKAVGIEEQSIVGCEISLGHLSGVNRTNLSKSPPTESNSRTVSFCRSSSLVPEATPRPVLENIGMVRKGQSLVGVLFHQKCGEIFFFSNGCQDAED